MINIKKICKIALILILVGAAGSIWSFNQTNAYGPFSEEKTFDEMSITDLRLEVDNAEVKIVPASSPETKIKLSGIGTVDIKPILVSSVTEGNLLMINLKEQDSKLFNFNIRRKIKETKLKVYLPQNQYKSIQIENRNGTIQIGELKIDNIKSKTDNGNIDLQNITSESIDAQSENGKISLNHVSGNITGKTSNGKISVVTANIDRSMQLANLNGSINVQTGEEPTNVTFAVQAQNGNINILNKYTGNAVIGQGENLVKLITTNGNITVTRSKP